MSPVTPLVSPQPPALPPPPLRVIASPNYNDRPGGETDIDTIVLHHTASSANAEGIAHFFQDPQSKVSSHYVVDQDGTVVEVVPDGKRAWHAGVSTFQGRGNVNDFSVGIEICNRGDNRDPYPEAQYRAVVDLVAYLVQAHQVPLERITRHRDVALPPGRKSDTSDNFD